MAIPQDQNLRLVSGRRFRILTVVDDFTRECLGWVVDTSLTGPRVVRELDHLGSLPDDDSKARPGRHSYYH